MIAGYHKGNKKGSSQMQNPKRVKAIRTRLKSEFEYYAPRCLKVLAKPDSKGKRGVIPFKLNAAQRHIHSKIEEQKASLGYVRAMILKGRQQGASTYTEGRFYWKTTQNVGEKTYILTHSAEATDNLFGMVDRYHTNAPVHVRPYVGKDNSKELVFDRLDSRYQVATAGSKGAGRSATLTNVHGSEVAFWERAEEHLGGMLQAVPLAMGTEVILESTANGVGNVFHKQWVMAERGMSDFIAIFVPWFWQDEYTRIIPDDFEVSHDVEAVPEGEPTEGEYQEAYKLTDGQIYWRRQKIIELGGGEDGYYLFKQEYPATSDEAFQSSASGNSLIKRKFVMKARKSDVASVGQLIIGVDPGGEGANGDPTGIIRRRGRRAFNTQKLTKLNTMQIAALVLRIIKNEKPLKVFIDVGGLGVGVVDRLLEMPEAVGVVVPVNFGESALDPEHYKNRRAEMHWTMKEWLEDAGGANIPDEDDLQADLLASVISPTDSQQRRQLMSKVWMKSKGIRSPNLADALALTFAIPVASIDAKQGNAQTDFDPMSGGANDWGNQGSSMTDFDVF